MTQASNPDTPPCCGPSRNLASEPAAQTEAQPSAPRQTSMPRVLVPGGEALLGTKTAGIQNDGESPVKRQRLEGFHITATTITNADFEEFVAATAYQTEAERIGWSFVFHAQVDKSAKPASPVPGIEWWRIVDGANWRDINGPGSYAQAWHRDHPAVQVSWNDATEFAKWVGGRLPTEAEWEHAARGGLGDVKFPWGDDEPDDTSFHPCNIWQGTFPSQNAAVDGYLTTAPARSFEPNGYGLYNVVGNVWEWTGDRFNIKSLKKTVKQRLRGMAGYKLSKGGSFLCHRSYCYRYRIAARTGSSPDSATPHHGFRVVWPRT